MLITVFNKKEKQIGFYKMEGYGDEIVEKKSERCLGDFDVMVWNYDTLIDALHSIMYTKGDVGHYKVEVV